MENIERDSFVISPVAVNVACKEDSYKGVLDTDVEISQLMNIGATVCVDLSGIISFDIVTAINRFLNSEAETGGDLMFVIDVNHPCIDTVLKIEALKGKLTVRADKKFMKPLAEGCEYAETLWKPMSQHSVAFKVKFKPYQCSVRCGINLASMVSNVDGEAVFNHDLLQRQLTDFDVEVSELPLIKSICGEVKKAIVVFCLDHLDEVLEAVGLQPGTIGSSDFLVKLNNTIKEATGSIAVIEKQFEMAKGIDAADVKAACIEAWDSGFDKFAVQHVMHRRGHYMDDEEHILKRPQVLDADVVRFQNKKEKWIAFIGLIDNRPYEIFTGIADDDEGIFCPKSVNSGKIIKTVDENGQKRYDFQFINKRGFKTTIEGLSEKFKPEYWNYAKLISGVLRYGMPLEQVVKLISSLELDDLSINTWKSGVTKALKKYLPGSED